MAFYGLFFYYAQINEQIENMYKKEKANGNPTLRSQRFISFFCFYVLIFSPLKYLNYCQISWSIDLTDVTDDIFCFPVTELALKTCMFYMFQVVGLSWCAPNVNEIFFLGVLS